VLTRRGARGRRARSEAGARLLDVRTRGPVLDLRAALQRLGDEGLTTLLVEGGGRLAAALLRANLVDEIHWLLAPRLIGAEGSAALGPLGIGKLADAPDLQITSTRRLGRDLHITARLPGAIEDSK